VTREEQWRREWEALRAEREIARRNWRCAADGLAAWARDPLGFKGLVRGHPIASAGIGAAVGALLARLLLRGPEPGEREEGPARPPAAWTTVLRDAAVGLAVPWLLRVLKEKFGGGPGPDEAPPAPRA
jgi:hypothetical protein